MIKLGLRAVLLGAAVAVGFHLTAMVLSYTIDYKPGSSLLGFDFLVFVLATGLAGSLLEDQRQIDEKKDREKNFDENRR